MTTTNNIESLDGLQHIVAAILSLQPKWSKSNTPDMQQRGDLIRNKGPAVSLTFLFKVASFVLMPKIT